MPYRQNLRKAEAAGPYSWSLTGSGKAAEPYRWDMAGNTEAAVPYSWNLRTASRYAL